MNYIITSVSESKGKIKFEVDLPYEDTVSVVDMLTGLSTLKKIPAKRIISVTCADTNSKDAILEALDSSVKNLVREQFESVPATTIRFSTVAMPIQRTVEL